MFHLYAMLCNKLLLKRISVVLVCFRSPKTNSPVFFFDVFIYSSTDVVPFIFLLFIFLLLTFPPVQWKILIGYDY